ncbi:hypothetical protein BGY98DRAFT_984725 [Russula aff. rugulosa BPL654]|nr:hypothetical protein BGY98DRAFT_984725 [Russula aff. rugulosa BPL654]
MWQGRHSRVPSIPCRRGGAATCAEDATHPSRNDELGETNPLASPRGPCTAHESRCVVA